MNTCKECAAWLGPRVDAKGHTVGNCANALMTDEQQPDRPYVFGEGVGHTNGCGLKFARLATPPNFGCVNWERKGK